MTNQKTNSQAILLDADVLIHFSKGQTIALLKQIYPQYEKWVLPGVKGEILHRKTINDLNFAINYKVIKEIDLPAVDTDVYREYARLKRDNPKIGEGEAQCLAFLRYNSHVLASSNLRDIRQYCETYEITYLTTLDLLSEAMRSNVLTEEECDKFIEDVLKQNSKLPCSYMFEYTNPTFLD